MRPLKFKYCQVKFLFEKWIFKAPNYLSCRYEIFGLNAIFKKVAALSAHRIPGDSRNYCVLFSFCL